MSKEIHTVGSLTPVELSVAERFKLEEVKGELLDEELGRQENENIPPEDDKLNDEPPVKKEVGSIKGKGYKILSCFLGLIPSIGDEGDKDAKKFEELLSQGARNIVQLIIPVSLCMAVVVAFQLAIAVHVPYTSSTVIYGVLTETGSGQGVLVGLIIAVVFICLVILSTVILILLFKYKCNKAIFVWLLLSSAFLVFLASSIYLVEILRVRNLVVDWFLYIFGIWNYGSLGLMVIHWKGPLRVQQGYLILNSALVAIILIMILPEWSTWLILGLLSIYDIIAVLCPKGPLRILIDLAKERGELNLPSLIYSSTMIWMVTMADTKKKTGRDKKTDGSNPGLPQSTNITLKTGSEDIKARNTASGDKIQVVNEEVGRVSQDTSRNRKKAHNMMLDDTTKSKKKESSYNGSESSQEGGDRGFKIGLGDLVFYSVLVGKASSISDGNWVIILSCFVAILMGLCLTSLILGIVHRALPALPISIFFGLAFYFASQYIIAPYVELLNVNQIHI